ncbi:hypothetical protein [Carnimonas bestiolae]|uniref:hypothetical protein n=1 Tax=Carnimonas bestiolae TaxID=3402172 RepID=UPI003EDC2D5E
MIDTAAYAKRLEEHEHIAPEVAKVIARERFEIEERIVTRTELRSELDHLAAKLEARLTVRMGVMLGFAVSVLAAIKFFG